MTDIHDQHQNLQKPHHLQFGMFLLLPMILALIVAVSVLFLSSHSHIHHLINLQEEQLSIWKELRTNQLRTGRRAEAPDPLFFLEKVRADSLALLKREREILNDMQGVGEKLTPYMKAILISESTISLIKNADIHPRVREYSSRFIDNHDLSAAEGFAEWLKATLPIVQIQGFLAPLEERRLLTYQFAERQFFSIVAGLLLACITLVLSLWLIWNRKKKWTIRQLNAAVNHLEKQNIELRRAERQSSTAQQTAKFGYWVRSSDGTITCSDGLLYILGIERPHAPTTFEELASCSPPIEHDKLMEFYRTSLAKAASNETVRTLKRADGKSLFLRERIEIPTDAVYSELQVFGIVLDITARKEAETRLVHAQKMEAVGQLTGGIAHDFNNLLAVITGNAELIALSAGERSSRHADAIIKTVERGRRLVDQLLLFSSRSSLSPEVLYLSDVLSAMSELVPRSLTEQVKLKFDIQEDLWPIYVDRSTFENCLLNLIINASSAIDGSGVITIAARNVSSNSTDVSEIAGDKVELQVKDNGCGMPEDVVQRAFEPFFTTRAKGEGSGLGLSMVYGFVKYSKGSISIDSKPNKGTTITILLPRSTASIRIDNKPKLSVPKGNGETVLVVEDQVELLDIVSAQLESLGYTTRQAENAPAAERILRNHPDIELMLTDIKLPLGISGLQLAESAVKINPELKILFTTGYADVDYGQISKELKGSRILRKPVGFQAMAEGIRNALSIN